MATKYKPQKDGRFQTKVWKGNYDEHGRKKYEPVYSDKSSKDLEKKVSEIRNSLKEGTYTVNTDELFITYAKKWLSVYKAVKSGNTKTMYQNIIDTHFKCLDGVRLQDVKRLHFQTIINNTMNHPRACQQIALTFKQIIKAAARDKLLPDAAFRDICEGIELPKYIPEEKRPLTQQEKSAISKANFTPMEKTFVLIAYGCGLRRGEILALTRFDVDLKNRNLTVNKSMAFNGNNPYLKDPKSNNGFRTVPMPPYLVDHMSRYLPSLKSSTLISKRNGDTMTKSSYDKMWAGIVRKMDEAAGGNEKVHVIYDLTAHVFRHNFCTNLCYQVPHQISIDTIARLMGDTKKMVTEIYSHAIHEKENPEEAINTALAL